MRRAAAVAKVQVGAAGGAQPFAIGLAEHHERRIHDHGVVDGISEVDHAVLAEHLKIVLIRVWIVRLGKEVVLLDLSGDLKRRGLQAAIALALGMGAHHTGNEHAIARVGEDHIVGDAVGQTVLLLAHTVAICLHAPRHRMRLAGILDETGQVDANGRKTGELRLPGHYH